MNRQMAAQPEAKSAPPIIGGLLQRKCACGQHTGGGECEECRKKKQSLQRKEGSGAEPQGVPPNVHEVLCSPGQPLSPATRSYMEPRFGQDFSGVRIHTDASASDSALQLNAQAYTVGYHVVFDSDRYQPSTMEGRRLLAHELTHVVQQRHMARPMHLALSSSSDTAEKEADATAARVLANTPPENISAQQKATVQRSVRVEEAEKLIPNPGGMGAVQTNAATAEGYLSTLCPGSGVKVDPKPPGTVTVPESLCQPLFWLLPSLAELSSTPTGCGCICDLINSPNEWRIKIDDAEWPHTDFEKGGGRVTAPSPNSPKLWGAATASGKEVDIDPWLVLGHELCGHAWLKDKGKHGPDETVPRGEGGHQKTVERENELRKEHGMEARGTFKEPNCGESYFRDKKTPGTVNWSSYRAVCEKWRQEYNKTHKTNYKITDKIP